MALLKDRPERTVRLVHAYGRHAVQGIRIKRDIRVAGTALDIYVQNALGDSTWAEMESLFYDGHVIPPDKRIFHPGIAADVADAYFPLDDPHPWTAYYSADLPDEVISDAGTKDDPDKMFGVFKCLLTGDWDEDGNQLNAAGAIVTPADPRTEFFYRPNPANAAADLILLRDRPFDSPVSVADWIAERKALIDWPSWVAWRDFNWVLIDDEVHETPRQIRRFEGHVFFQPPYELSLALDKLCQISCADWQWAGGKIKFLHAGPRASVYTFNAAEFADGAFKTYDTDRRQRFNQVLVNFRDLDNEYLNIADPPVIVPPEDVAPTHPWKLIQTADKRIKPFTIDGGCLTRSQAQRLAYFWGRTLIDLDKLVGVDNASPRSYPVLPADVVDVSYDVPNWSGIEFKILEKTEHIEGQLGDQLIMQLYDPDTYSDTDQSPLVRPLPSNNPDPFAAPPIVVDVTLTELGRAQGDGAWTPAIQGSVEFAPFAPDQRGRVWVHYPSDAPGVFQRTDIRLAPEDRVDWLAGFEIPTVEIGEHEIRVITESVFGVKLPDIDHPIFTIEVVGLPPPAPAPNTLTKTVGVEGDLLYRWLDDPAAPKRGEEDRIYLFEILTAGGALKRDATIRLYLSEPLDWTRITDLSAANCGTVSVIKGDGTLRHTGDSLGACYFESQRFSGDTFFEFEVETNYPPLQFAIVGAQVDVVFTVDPATDIITAPGHEFEDGDRVNQESTGVVPTGMGPLAELFVRDVAGDTFKLAATIGGAAMDFTTAGTGTHTMFAAGSGVYFEMVQYAGVYYIRPEILSVDPAVRVPGSVRVPLPTDRYAIDIVSRHARYFYNWHGPESIPMWTSGQYRLPKWVKAVAVLGFLNGEAQAAARCRGRAVFAREFRYTAEMQRKDNTGSLSAVNRVRLRQWSELLQAYGPALDVTL